jgi:diguanylate cyclase (GGDEF)-like protein
MIEKTTSIQRILVIGAGRGGTSLIELFLDDPHVIVVGIVDKNPQAPALALAGKRHIPIFASLDEAIAGCGTCLAFNVTGDESVTAYAETKLGEKNVIGGSQARFFWKVATRLKLTNEKVLHLAHHDSLTELPNRILFRDRINQSIVKARREKELIAVLYLDLDGFKRVNDTLGHDIGDALLQEASKRIVACVRDSDTVARMGGDEFTVILCNVKTPESIERVAQKIVDAIAAPFDLNGKNCSVSVSIGISLYPNNGETPDQLMKSADSTMYQAKQSGKNCYRIASV